MVLVGGVELSQSKIANCVTLKVNCISLVLMNNNGTSYAELYAL